MFRIILGSVGAPHGDPCMYLIFFVYEKLIHYHQIIDWLKNVTGNTKTITKINKHTHNMIGHRELFSMDRHIQY